MSKCCGSKLVFVRKWMASCVCVRFIAPQSSFSCCCLFLFLSHWAAAACDVDAMFPLGPNYQNTRQVELALFPSRTDRMSHLKQHTRLQLFELTHDDAADALFVYALPANFSPRIFPFCIRKQRLRADVHEITKSCSRWFAYSWKRSRRGEGQ